MKRAAYGTDLSRCSFLSVVRNSHIGPQCASRLLFIADFKERAESWSHNIIADWVKHILQMKDFIYRQYHLGMYLELETGDLRDILTENTFSCNIVKSSETIQNIRDRTWHSKSTRRSRCRTVLPSIVFVIGDTLQWEPVNVMKIFQ